MVAVPWPVHGGLLVAVVHQRLGRLLRLLVSGLVVLVVVAADVEVGVCSSVPLSW